MSNLWMPLYVADYLADTGHLSTVEHGAYMLLIMHYWQHENLPSDDRTLARIARMRPEHWRKIRPQLECFFTSELSGLWVHVRIDQEIAKALKLREQKSNAGKASANARSTAVQHTYQRQSNQPQPQLPTQDTDKISYKDFVVGNGVGARSKLSTDAMRAKLHNSIVERFRDRKEAWEVILAAEDVAAPGHSAALKICQGHVHDMGKRWPLSWV